MGPKAGWLWCDALLLTAGVAGLVARWELGTAAELELLYGDEELELGGFAETTGGGLPLTATPERLLAA